MARYEFYKPGFDGLNLYFQYWQAEQKPKGVICLIHGLGEYSGRYAHWAEMLNQVGYSLFTYDLRGHGKSGGKRGHVSSFVDYVRDIDQLMEEELKKFPGMPVFLYGHSLGGIIACDYVLRRKPKLNGVVITALGVKNSLQEQKAKVMLSSILGSIVPTMSISSGLVPATISRDPEVVYQYTHDPMIHNKVSFGWGKSAFETINYVQEHAHEWELPVLFMHGEKDALGYAEGSREYAQKISCDCTVKIWPEMFHEIHNEPEKEQVFEFLRKWLDAHL